MGVLAETTLVADMWWSGNTWRIKGITIAGTVIEVTQRGLGYKCYISTSIMRSISGTIAMRGLTLVVMMVNWHCSGLGKNLEVFHGLRIKVLVTMMKVIIDMFLGEGIEEQNLGFFIIKFLFITTI